MDWLNNPAVQAGIAPFVAAAVAGFVLRRIGWVWAGLALVAGIAVCIHLVAGWQLTPLSSTRKLVVLALALPLVGLVADLYPFSRKPLAWVLAIASAGAALWVIWPVLMRQQGAAQWLMGGAVAAYVAWLAYWFDGLRTDALRASSAGIALGFGSGGAALLGATALYGQLGIAVGAAAGAVWLMAAVSAVRVGGSFTLLAGTWAALIGCSAAVYSSLPWYSLLPLLAVPLVARVPSPGAWPRPAQALVNVLPVMAFAAASVWLTYRAQGAPPI